MRNVINNEQGRDEKATVEERDQPDRQREQERDREQEDEAMNDHPDRHLGELDNALETQEFPTTTEDLIETYGDYDIETQDGSKSLETVLAQTDDQTFVSADDVRSRILGLIHR